MGRPKKSGTKQAKSGNGANLGFEEKLWAAADKMRGHMDAGEYKHVALGLIFLKYISDAFQERYDALKLIPHADPEDRDEYTAENVFWVPQEARWDKLQAGAKSPEIGKTIDLGRKRGRSRDESGDAAIF
jgi:type I restriction enzyme M protein